MSFTGKFKTALDAYKSGNIDLRQIDALASDNPTQAQFLAGQALQNELPTPIPSSSTVRLLELVWKLSGIDSCIHGEFVGLPVQSVVDAFILDRLTRSPEEFSDYQLEVIAHLWTRKKHQFIPLRVQAIQHQRIAVHADQRLSVPRELSRDVVRVQERVSEYHFSGDLNALLQKVEDGLGIGDAFDQKSLLGHIRTFFEKLHTEIAEVIHRERPALKDGTDLTKCQQVIDYLERKDVLTEKMKQLGRALYGVLSNEGVHAISSEREYVRLCRNMVAEYALIVFFELNRALGR